MSEPAAGLFVNGCVDTWRPLVMSRQSSSTPDSLPVVDLANFDVREENIVDADLPPAMFDLVHTRWTLMHIPERERVLQKLVDCLALGGTLFVEEPDSISVRTLDRSGFIRSLSLRVFEIVSITRIRTRTGVVISPFKMTSLGLGNVRAEGEHPYFRGASELAEFWRLSWGRVRDAVAQTGTDITQWDSELAELDDPTRLFVSPMTIAVIATKA